MRHNSDASRQELRIRIAVRSEAIIAAMAVNCFSSVYRKTVHERPIYQPWLRHRQTILFFPTSAGFNKQTKQQLNHIPQA
jgi:hypothetical protein